MARKKMELLRNRKIKSKKSIKKQTGLWVDQIQKRVEIGVANLNDAESGEECKIYCIECNREFIAQEALDSHKKTKLHKKRVKDLKDVCHTQKHAELAAGLL